MDIFLLGMLIFVLVVVIIELVHYALRAAKDPDRVKLKKRLKSFAGISAGSGRELLRSETLSSIPWFHRFLNTIPVLKQAEQLRRQANAGLPLGFYLLLSLTLGFIGFAIVMYLYLKLLPALAAVFIGALLPWGYLVNMKQKRMERFRHQLPEALDLIARSLRAGHAFSSGLKLASQQFADPVGTEFGTVIDEINFGISVQDALRNLAQRVNSPEVKFFIVAVILQRETGGNLAEIMEANAQLIRERFKFQNNVKTLSAEGKFSAVILILLPIFMGFVLYAINPEYMILLFTEKIGRIMLMGIGILMVIGVLIMKRMLKIQV